MHWDIKQKLSPNRDQLWEHRSRMIAFWYFDASKIFSVLQTMIFFIFSPSIGVAIKLFAYINDYRIDRALKTPGRDAMSARHCLTSMKIWLQRCCFSMKIFSRKAQTFGSNPQPSNFEMNFANHCTSILLHKPKLRHRITSRRFQSNGKKEIPP